MISGDNVRRNETSVVEGNKVINFTLETVDLLRTNLYPR